MDTCICIAESLHCSPKTITTLLISYTPIQTTKLKKKKKKDMVTKAERWPEGINRELGINIHILVNMRLPRRRSGKEPARGFTTDQCVHTHPTIYKIDD